MTVRCRILIDDSIASKDHTDTCGDGAFNLAMDETLLDRADGPILRWYSWQPATISLGYFQALADLPTNLATLSAVRRPTGGGAILHDRDLTYSLIVPRSLLPDRPQTLVTQVHQAFAEGLQPWVVADLNPRSLPPSTAEPFLCFDRRSVNDLVVGPHKILGSAQRLRRHALLQHGSLMLETSSLTPHLRGLRELTSRILEVRSLLDEVSNLVLAERNWHGMPSRLTEHEVSAASNLASEKYRSRAWNLNR